MQQPRELVDFHDWHAYSICTEMRPDEIEQYLAFTGAEKYDFEVAARGMVAMPGVKFTMATFDADGVHPYVIGGYQEVRPGVWQSWMAGTMEAWETKAKSITKGARWLQHQLFENGARRLQTNGLASRTQALEWYERNLHMKCEGVWEEFGANGEDVACYAITRSRYYGQQQ